MRARASLTVDGYDDAWTAGDCAAVPDLTNPGEFCAPNAQHAVRQARLLARNIGRALRGKPLRDYRHKYIGSLASLGLHKGVAQIYGFKLRGWPAWFMHRTYHVSRVPTLNRKIRIVLDGLALFFRRDVDPRVTADAARGLQGPPFRRRRRTIRSTMRTMVGTRPDRAAPPLTQAWTPPPVAIGPDGSGSRK